MSECEYCGETVEDPAHQVVNGRIYMNDDDCCQSCGFDDEQLVEWVREHQPGSMDIVQENLEDSDD